MEEWIWERFDLARERVLQLRDLSWEEDPFREFIARQARFLGEVLEAGNPGALIAKGSGEESSGEESCREDSFGEGKFLPYFYPEGLSLSKCQERGEALFRDISGEAYAHSFGNPSYARERLGSYGPAFTFLYGELFGILDYAAQGRLWDVTVLLELFLLTAREFLEEEGRPTPSQFMDDLRSYVNDYCQEMTRNQVEESLRPGRTTISWIVEEADLSDLRYLYAYGMNVTNQELEVAAFLNDFSQEEIQRMAQVYVGGFLRGFQVGGKDLSKKKTVQIRYHLGFERVVREAVRLFRREGLEPLLYRGSSHVGSPGLHPVTTTSANLQYVYDHRQDNALFLSPEYVQLRLRCMQEAYEEFKEEAGVLSGPALLEAFGEEPFSPVLCKDALTLAPEQEAMKRKLTGEISQIVSRYIPQEERSFTIVAWPLPSIGENFPEIFRGIWRVNTLDNQVYQRGQQVLIDRLDSCQWVYVKGREGNDTDMIIHLHDLKDPQKETNFENCLADVNIPLGEVFTSPVLGGTGGTLHVSGVYLGGLYYKNLRFVFDCGQVIDYSCENFDTEEENRKYIKDNVLHGYEKIPMGEFAIGTNTEAYALARRYGIEGKLPILIAEKMGPHFALGDTCYSHEEDHKVYNPDGKECIARENELSALRNEDPELAYYDCHTDVTLPYDELEEISVIDEEGEFHPILKGGRFVLEGTEILNAPLEQVEGVVASEPVFDEEDD